MGERFTRFGRVSIRVSVQKEKGIAMNNGMILRRLACDSKFREDFFANPRRAVSDAGLEASEDEISEIKNFDWDGLRCHRSTFQDEEVLRMCVDC